MDDESEQTPLANPDHDTREEDLPAQSTITPDGNEEIVDILGAKQVNGNQSLQATLQRFADRAIDFLSSASNETLGACLVGLGATTYFILGRVGLVVIGVAGGIVLHATWEKPTDDRARQLEESRRKEVSLDVVHRILKWRESRRDEHVGSHEEYALDRVDVDSKSTLDFTGFRAETAAALNEFTDAAIRDYVKWWYSPILPNEDIFPQSSRRTLVAFLTGISNHMSRKRPADVFLDFLTHSSSILTVFFNELRAIVSASPNAEMSDALEIYLKSKPESNLANIVDVGNQEKKLNLVAEDILQCYLDHKAYNCEPVRTFLQQVLARLCIANTIIACAKPEFINGWIVYLLEEGEPELMKEIDASMEGVTDGSQATHSVEAAVEEADSQRAARHKRVVSRAQEAMDEAMQEATRLSQLIAEHDAEKLRQQLTEDASASEAPSKPRPEPVPSGSTITPSSSGLLHDDTSESTTQGIDTPTSSRSDTHGEEDLRMTNLASQDECAEGTPTSAPKTSIFTSFDQLDPNLVHTTSQDTMESEKKEVDPLTLYNAKVTIYDDSDPADRRAVKQKPAADYMIQVEPATSQYPGWMIFRKYIDFENLHGILGPLAKIDRVAAFAEAHPTLPNWKGRTSSQLREDLERYLMDAVRYQSLAESEAMKRFLEKEQALSRSPGNKAGFGWPTPAAFESMGKGVVDALTKAPKEVAGGGKAIIGGVSNVLIGGKNATRSRASPKTFGGVATAASTPSVLPRTETNLSIPKAHPSQDSIRSPSPVIDTQPAPIAPMESKPEADEKPRPPPKLPSDKSSSVPALGGDQIIQLPPPPSDITDDYDPTSSVGHKHETIESVTPLRHASTSTFASSSESIRETPSHPKPKASLTEEETQVAVELIFATIQELYTLSSAWALRHTLFAARRTLLAAAKNFLLRPGNPQLLSIRELLQATVLDANTSDAGIATHIRKLRLNALPTEEELKLWPAEMSLSEKEELRAKARKMLVERGMPAALTSVMGKAATGDALERVFDALQEEKVARGLVFGIMLQALRTITQ